MIIMIIIIIVILHNNDNNDNNNAGRLPGRLFTQLLAAALMAITIALVINSNVCD